MGLKCFRVYTGCSSIRFSYSRNSARIDVYLFMDCVNAENTHEDLTKKRLHKISKRSLSRETK